jgi:hypothetical protein
MAFPPSWMLGLFCPFSVISASFVVTGSTTRRRGLYLGRRGYNISHGASLHSPLDPVKCKLMSNLMRLIGMCLVLFSSLHFSSVIQVLANKEEHSEALFKKYELLQCRESQNVKYVHCEGACATDGCDVLYSILPICFPSSVFMVLCPSFIYIYN